MDDGLRASAVMVGDEILAGFVRDTNSGFLAERLRAHGVPLDRVHTVPDTVEAIGEALGSELARSRPRLVLTSGGVGSTPDDLTWRAVAAHLDREVVSHPDLRARIDRVVDDWAREGAALAASDVRALRSMALVPDGARVLPGARGLAPGVVVDVDGGVDQPGGAAVVALPGIPAELQRIVTESVEPGLLAGRGRPLTHAEVAHPYPESVLSEHLADLVAREPDVRVGSYPGPTCTVRLSGPPQAVARARDDVARAVDAIAARPDAARLRERWRRRWAFDDPDEPGRKAADDREG